VDVSAPTLEEVLCKRLSPEATAWLQSALQQVESEVGSESFLTLWSGAGRRLGRAVLTLDQEEAKGLPLMPQGWGLDELGRGLLLLREVAALPAEGQVALVEEVYRTGEIRERQAVLRVLSALPGPARYLSLAVDAIRANVLTEIEAIACENPYPGRYFSDEAFNQMVLKCLFNGVSLTRIVGLRERRGTELQRMVAGYAAERRAAGRSVPEDVALVLEGG
jgi:hypothetical protein